MHGLSHPEATRKPGRCHNPEGHRCGPWGRSGTSLFGAEVGSVSPGAQVTTALFVLAPVLLSGIFLVALVPELWWIFTTYGWVSFPAFGLLARGLSGLASEPPGRRASIEVESEERELLEALAEHGELTPLKAAMETSLSVAEADRMLRELAEGGHLEVRIRGGGLFYSLWKLDGGDQS